MIVKTYSSENSLYKWHSLLMAEIYDCVRRGRVDKFELLFQKVQNKQRAARSADNKKKSK